MVFLTSDTPFAPIDRPAALQPLLFNSYNQNNPQLKRLRAQELDTDIGSAALFSVGGTAVSAFDTIVSSLGLVEEDDVEKFLAEQSPEFGNFFLRHRDRFQISGDIAGLLLTGGAAGLAVRTTGVVGRGMTRLFGDRVKPFLSTGKSAQELSETAVKQAQFLMRQPQTRTFIPNKELIQARNRVPIRRTLDAAIEMTAGELAIVATMNDSNFLFPEEMSMMENALWALGTNSVVGLGFWAHGSWAVRRALREVTDEGRVASTNPGNLPFMQLTGNIDPGRGPALGILGQQLQNLKTQAGTDGITQEAASNVATATTAVKERIAGLAKQAMNRQPLEGINDVGQLNDKEMKNIVAQVEKNPELFHGLQSLEPETLTQNALERSRKIEERLTEIPTAIAKLKKKLEKPAIKNKVKKDLIKQARILQEERDQLERLQPVTFELDGTISVGTTRAPIFQDGARDIKYDEKEGLFRTKIGEGEIVINKHGQVKFPSTFCPSVSKSMRITRRIASHFPLGATTAVAGMSLNDAFSKLKGAVPEIWKDNPDVRQIRARLKQDEAVPNKFIGFAKGGDTTFLKFNKGTGAGFSQPVIASVDDVIGTHPEGRGVLAEIPTYQNMTPELWAGLDHRQKTAVWDLMQAGLEKVEKPPGGIDKVLLQNAKTGELHHTQLDYAATLFEREGRAAREVEELWYLSLASKFRDFQTMRIHADQAEKQGKTHIYHNMENVARALNLDAESGLLEIFDSLRVRRQIMDLEDTHPSLQAITEEIRKRLGISDEILAAEGPEAIVKVFEPQHFRGSMLDLPRDQSLVGGFLDTAVQLDEQARQGLLQNVTNIRENYLQTLARSKQSQIVAPTVKFLRKQPQLIGAIKDGVQKLVAGIQMYGPFGRNLLQAHFALRDQPGLEALDAAIDNIQKLESVATKQILEKASDFTRSKTEQLAGKPEILTRKEIMASLLRRDAKSVAGLEMFHIARAMRGQGWSLTKSNLQKVELPNGEFGYQFVLGKKQGGAHNAKLFQKLYPNRKTGIGNQTVIPVPGKPDTPLTLPETTFRVVKTVGDIMGELLTEVNLLRRAKGLKEIGKREFWLPPVALEGKELRYLINEIGDVERIVSDVTEAGVQGKVTKELEHAKNNGRTLFAVTHDTIQRYQTAGLKAVFDTVDFSSPMRQTGPMTGKTAPIVFERGAKPYQKMQEGMLRAFADLGRQLRFELFDPELQFLQMEHASLGLSKGKESLFSFAASRISGTPGLDPESFVGKGLLTTEHLYNKVMEGLATTRNLLPKAPGEGKSTFAKLEAQYGKEFNPFDDVNDYLARTHDVKIPGTLHKHAAVLGEVTAAFALRAFDLGMGAINMLSLGVTLPPVIRMALPRPGEPDNVWRERVLAFGGTTPKGTPWLSPTKIALGGMRYMFTKEGKAVREMATARGYMDQYAAEAIGLYDRTGQGFITSVVRDWVDKVSIATDYTERMARGVAWMSFYRLGKQGFGLDSEAAMVFAHKQANNTIADFRPGNRPTLFQGAAGMPLALFSTYMWNFLQRIYRVVETADGRTAASQAGLQASLFGINSMPGAQAYIQALGANEDGTLNVEDRISQVLGKDLADVLMHGSISTLLPRTLGLGGGIDIGSRAGIGLPFSRVLTGNIIEEPSRLWANLWKAAPGLQFSGRLLDTFGKAFDRISAGEGFGMEHAAEILAASNINKGMTNILELAQGYSVDHAEHIIEEDTRTLIGASSRAIGFKPLKTTQTQAAARRINNTKRVQNAMKQQLGEWLKTELRDGSLTTDGLDYALGRYMKAGGSPRNFRNWYLSQVRRGTESKADMLLAEATRANNEQRRVAHLLFMMQDEY